MIFILDYFVFKLHLDSPGTEGSRVIEKLYLSNFIIILNTGILVFLNE